MLHVREAMSTVLARVGTRSMERVVARKRREPSMKLGNSLLLFALTAGLAVLAITGAKHEVETADTNSLYEDVDAWFV